MRVVIANAASVVSPASAAHVDATDACLLRNHSDLAAVTAPLAPSPSRTIEMTMYARWCQSMNDSSRISRSCADSTEAVRQKTPQPRTKNRRGVAGAVEVIGREAITLRVPVGCAAETW